MIKQFIKYTSVGGIGTIGHYCTLIMLFEWLNINLLIATTLGFLTGAVINYLLNYYYVFNNNKGHRAVVAKFFTIVLMGIILNYGTMYLLKTQTNWHYIIMQIIATFIILLSGFLLNRIWTFK